MCHSSAQELVHATYLPVVGIDIACTPTRISVPYLRERGRVSFSLITPMISLPLLHISPLSIPRCHLWFASVTCHLYKFSLTRLVKVSVVLVQVEDFGDHQQR